VLPEPGPLLADLRAEGVDVLVRPLAALRRELMNPRGAVALSAGLARDGRDLTSLIRRRRVVLVHSNTSILLGGGLAARLTGVPHVCHVREIYRRFGRAWPPYRAILQRAAALPCISAATAGQFDSGRSMVIYDGLATNGRRAERAPARRALGLPQDAPVLVLPGRITDWKGQTVLARALAEPALRERRALGVIAGDAWPGAEHRRARLLAEADRLGVRERLRLIGFRDDVENVLGAADIVVVPSTEPEPLGAVAVEAAAAGCAVVASDTGGLPEVIRDGLTGRLCPPGDAAALSRIAAELLGDPRQRERLGRAASADARRRFAPERLLAEVQALYDRLLV